MKTLLLIALGAALCLGVAAASPPASTQKQTHAIEIEIANFTFEPATVTIKVGTTVTWINQDDIPHTVVSTGSKGIRSPALDTGDKYPFTFSHAGTYLYYCSVHPRMVGKVIVKE